MEHTDTNKLYVDEQTSQISSVPFMVEGNEKPSLIIHLNYSKNSHILSGVALKDVYSDFRINVLREANWAHWHAILTRDPSVAKGWTIKKDFLAECENQLIKFGIPYTKVDSNIAEKKPALNPFWRFAHDNWSFVVAGLSKGVKRKEIIAEIKKMWAEEKKNPNSIYKSLSRKSKAPAKKRVNNKKTPVVLPEFTQAELDAQKNNDFTTVDVKKYIKKRSNKKITKPDSGCSLESSSETSSLESSSESSPLPLESSSESESELPEMQKLIEISRAEKALKDLGLFMTQTDTSEESAKKYMKIAKGDLTEAITLFKSVKASPFIGDRPDVFVFIRETGGNYASAMDHLGVTDGDVDWAIKLYKLRK